MFNNFVSCLKKCLDFSGRASRYEFWAFLLVAFIINLVLGLFSVTLASLFGLLMILPTVAVTIRRLRDVKRSPLHVLWWLLGPIGLIVLAVLCSKK